MLLLFCQVAEAQYTAGFESGEGFVADATGVALNGQGGFYLPAAGGVSADVYTYAGNTLGIIANPTGGDQFVAGNGPGPAGFVRSQLDVVYGAGTGFWTVSYDINVTFQGVLPSAQNVGSFSTQDFPGDATFIALATWTDPTTAATWNADYVWFDANDNQLTEQVPNPAFQNLALNNWYRWSTTFDFDTNRIVRVELTDITGGGAPAVYCPPDRFMDGGSAGGVPPANGFRFFVGSATVAGNTISFDNVDISECTTCCPVITDLNCDVNFPDVDLSWTNGITYPGGITVERDGVVVFTDPTGTATSFNDPALPLGTYTYTVNGDCGTGFVTCPSCTVTVGGPPPANDDCADAQDIVGALPVSVTGQNETATDDADLPCGNDDNTGDVHFTRTATITGFLRVDTCQSTDPDGDTIITVWEAGTDCASIVGGTAVSIGCDDDSCGPVGFNSQVDVPVTAGNEYIITVSGWMGLGHTFTLTLSESPARLPEECDFSGTPGAAEETQSSSQAIVPGNSVSCNAGGITADNGYYRLFETTALPAGAIDILAIEIGIEVADAGAGFDTQPINMRLHDHTGVYIPGGPILPGTLSPLGSQSYGLPTLIGNGIECFAFTPPISVDTTAINELGVEVDVPSAFNNGRPHVFFIGSNPDPETRQSYLRSVDCAVPDPLPTASIGFPDMHIVMNVHYVQSVNPDPEYFRGDADGNDVLNALVDALFLLAFGFQGGPPPPCMDEADVDGNGVVNALVDVLYLLAFGFQGGPPPPAPNPCANAPEVVGCLNPGC